MSDYITATGEDSSRRKRGATDVGPTDTLGAAAFRRRAFNRMRQLELPLSGGEEQKLTQLQRSSDTTPVGGKSLNHPTPVELERVTGGIRSKRRV